MKVIVLTKNINTSGKKNSTQQLCNKEAFDEVEYINILLQSSRSVPSFQSLPLQRVNMLIMWVASDGRANITASSK